MHFKSRSSNRISGCSQSILLECAGGAGTHRQSTYFGDTFSDLFCYRKFKSRGSYPIFFIPVEAGKVSVPTKPPGLTVGVITHDRSTLFCNLLVHLKVAIEHFHATGLEDATCTLLVVNNSGEQSRAVVQRVVDESAIGAVCAVAIIDSPENNIAIGRNLILERTQTRWLVFIDDDEYPVPGWIRALYAQQQASGSAVVAGPIEPVYPAGTPKWVASVDLHNKGNLRTGDKLRLVATGNCLLDLQQAGAQRFDPAFGLSGGSDSLYFDQLAESGMHVVWCENAIVHETIPASRTSSRYMVFRCMTQGQNFKRVVLRKAELPQQTVFMLKAFLVAPMSLVVGTLALPISSRVSAYWLKRGFTNLGKLIRPSKRLYG